ncbi:MAG: HTTM domain-containing protein [Desmonostoc geniculatum HA4340-LM1]|nr:HTTM domain-containing protein [Desmonostoc geniculatum HA4340-LM1]
MIVSNVSLKEKIERFYRHHKTLILIHSSLAILWSIAIWLMYLLFPNQLETRILLSRAIFTGICIQFLGLAVQKRHYLLKTIREFFLETTHPINLAIFRIVHFEIIFSSDISQVVWFSQLPKELVFAPIGLEWLINIIPINATIAQIASFLFKICSFTAMIGIFTRTSAWLTVILGFYVLGIPQFYGKVDHYHHLLWFAAILAASRCADVLSLDAIFMAWKRADRGQLEPPSLSRVYALPLRFVWILLGIIYLFPGLYKLFVGGFDWAFSDNLKYRLYTIWLDLDGWIPVFRLDQYPILYQLSAFGSIFFEVSFIFLIFFPRTRYVAAFAGAGFHLAIYHLMKINFISLIKVYVTFFDFNDIFRGIGHRLFPQDMYVIYDGNCQLCRRTIATLRVFDVFGRLTFVNALDNQALTTHNLLWLDSQALMADMHTVLETKSWKGFLVQVTAKKGRK